MEFKIGLISKMTGLSASGIRYLEEKGFIKPSGGRKGTYRNYGIIDVMAILNYRSNRSFGLTEEEIFAMKDGVTLAQYRELLDTHCEELETEILEKMRLSRHIRQRCRDILLAEKKESFFEVTERPALIWFPLTETPGMPFQWPENPRFVLPYLDSVLRFCPGPDGSADAAAAEIGIGLLETETREYGFPEQERTRFFPKSRALHMITEIGIDMRPTAEDRERIHQMAEKFLSQGNEELSGQILTKRIVTAEIDGSFRRYDHLWMDLR